MKRSPLDGIHPIEWSHTVLNILNGKIQTLLECRGLDRLFPFEIFCQAFQIESVEFDFHIFYHPREVARISSDQKTFKVNYYLR